MQKKKKGDLKNNLKGVLVTKWSEMMHATASSHAGDHLLYCSNETQYVKMTLSPRKKHI